MARKRQKVYEMRLYGVLYHKVATSADEARDKLATELSKRYKTLRGKPASKTLLKRHIKLVKVHD
jgi:hypothetical protein